MLCLYAWYSGTCGFGRELNEYFDIDNIIYSLIVTSLPLNIHQDNEKIAKIEGVSEDIEDDITSSPFDKLKDIDLD